MCAQCVSLASIHLAYHYSICFFFSGNSFTYRIFFQASERQRACNRKTNWAEVLEAEDVSRAWETWKDKILDIAQRHIPKRILPYHSSGQRPWMTAAIRHEIKAKHRLFREYKRSRLPAARLTFKQQRNKVNSQI